MEFAHSDLAHADPCSRCMVIIISVSSLVRPDIITRPINQPEACQQGHAYHSLTLLPPSQSMPYDHASPQRIAYASQPTGPHRCPLSMSTVEQCPARSLRRMPSPIRIPEHGTHVATKQTHSQGCQLRQIANTRWNLPTKGRSFVNSPAASV